jgi:hypothetical protein
VNGPSPLGLRGALDSDFYTSAVYGSIIAAAIVGAFREEPVSSETTALALISSMTVIWLSHVWAAIVGEQLHARSSFKARHAGIVTIEESPMVLAAFIPTAALILGWGAVLTHAAAFNLALAICLLQLLAWGFFVGLRAYRAWWAACASGLLNGVLGIVVVSLEIAVLHH